MIGGSVWQSGGDIWLVLFERADGKLMIRIAEQYEFMKVIKPKIVRVSNIYTHDRTDMLMYV